MKYSLEKEILLEMKYRIDKKNKGTRIKNTRIRE